MFLKFSSAFKSNSLLLNELKNAAIITINRPTKMNSFTLEMNK